MGASNQSERPEEKPAIRTTIVGGRPPGCGKDVGEIPRGIEVLVKKASVDPEFKALLLEKREGAAERIGLELAESEILLLRSIPKAHLETVISHTQVRPMDRKAFLGYAAATMLATLGLVSCDPGWSGGSQPPPAPAGVPPDRPPMEEETTKGIRPDRPPESKDKGGIRPDRPPEEKEDEEKEDEEKKEEPKPEPDPKPPEPQPPTSRGIRPDRP